jgi:RNA-directed DNA polymerase
MVVLLFNVVGYLTRAAGFNYNNGCFHVNGNNNINNAGLSRGMVLFIKYTHQMKSYKNIYFLICKYENLFLAWRKARKHKTKKQYVLDFEKDLVQSIVTLQNELLLHSYRPKPLKTFTLRDPKTRKISVSDFRDRIIHHAICNLIEPIFEEVFISDSYANRKGKGTLAALKRLKSFMKKVSKNKTIIHKFGKKRIFRGFYLKGDIQRYFDSINHEMLLKIINKRIKDKRLLHLIKTILSNNNPNLVGLPLGNLTSQFFANVYLNELDQFVKHKLKAKYYIRYVDDFVILHSDESKLAEFKEKIGDFLQTKLLINLHPEKSLIKPISRGIEFLGFRNFYDYRLLRKRNIRRTYGKLRDLERKYKLGEIGYDTVYDYLEGWSAYVSHSNTHKRRLEIAHKIQNKFPTAISTKEVNRIIKEEKKQNNSRISAK